MTVALVQHPTLPDWMYHQFEHNDGSKVITIRHGYRRDTPPDEPLIIVTSVAITAVSQQFVIQARKWDREHDKKHNHQRRPKT